MQIKRAAGSIRPVTMASIGSRMTCCAPASRPAQKHTSRHNRVNCLALGCCPGQGQRVFQEPQASPRRSKDGTTASRMTAQLPAFFKASELARHCSGKALTGSCTYLTDKRAALETASTTASIGTVTTMSQRNMLQTALLNCLLGAWHS